MHCKGTSLKLLTENIKFRGTEHHEGVNHIYYQVVATVNGVKYVVFSRQETKKMANKQHLWRQILTSKFNKPLQIKSTQFLNCI